MPSSSCHNRRRAFVRNWLGTSFRAIGDRRQQFARISVLVLIGLSAQAACAQYAVDGVSSGGPAIPYPPGPASVAWDASQGSANAPPQETQQHDPRVHLVPQGGQQLEIIQHRSQLIQTSSRVRRIHIADPSVLDVIQFSEQEFSLIGVALGTTDLTFWFEGSDAPLLYVANVIRDPLLDDQRRYDYGRIERKLAVLYPNSKVYLIPMSRKIIVRGQARDAEEAARIMQIVRGEVLTQEGDHLAGHPGTVSAADGDLLASLIVNELQVPGEFQVMLRVRIAELSHSQLRRLGINWNVIFKHPRHHVGQLFVADAPVLTGLFDNGEISTLLNALASNGSAKILEDSVVVTMSGNPASFLSGGEFAVPNTVGSNGVLVGTTTFREFGTSIKATPTVIDGDLIRLQIIPELSAINSVNSVGGVPGVDVRRVQTAVELREGQTIVLGGLYSRRREAVVNRVPVLSGIPVVGKHLFSAKQAAEDETEMLIVVTPEIVRPMDAEDVPPLPGFYVTHPNDCDLYHHNRTEGDPDFGPYRVLPYGNGCGYGENVGFGFQHSQGYSPGYYEYPSDVMGPESEYHSMPPGDPTMPQQIQPQQIQQQQIQRAPAAPPRYEPQAVLGGQSRDKNVMPPAPQPVPGSRAAVRREPALIQQASGTQPEKKPAAKIRYGRWKQ